MSSFGKKDFEEKKTRIQHALAQFPASSSRFAANKEEELDLEYGNIAKQANDIFDFDGWSHSVTYQPIDFIDFDKIKYDVGVGVLVKVMLKDGTFHEGFGYGISRGFTCKGTAIAQAKKRAANDGLRNALRAFGNYLNQKF